MLTMMTFNTVAARSSSTTGSTLTLRLNYDADPHPTLGGTRDAFQAIEDTPADARAEHYGRQSVGPSAGCTARISVLTRSSRRRRAGGVSSPGLSKEPDS